MQQQLNLWTNPQNLPQALDIWKGLDQQEQKSLIEVLARLISKAVHPKANDNTQEKKNEQ